MLVSVPLPWTETMELDEERFRKAIAKLAGEGASGLYLFGTSGEGYALSREEFSLAVSIFAEVTKDLPLFRQAGCYGTATGQVLGRLETAARAGLEGAQVTLPFWQPLDDPALFRYYEDLGRAFPEMSLLHYNDPRSKRKLTGAELHRLQEVCPSLRAAKTGSGSWMDFHELVTASPGIRHFVTEMPYLFCKPLGAAGVIPSLNYAAPGLTRRYVAAVDAGDLPTASALHRLVVRFFFETALPLARKGYMDGAIDKAYARFGGMDMPLRLKSPYSSLTDEEEAWLAETIRAVLGDELER